MSEDSAAVVRMDVDGVDVAALAAKLTDLLLSRKVIAANLRRDGLWQPSAWAPGPDWQSVLEPHPEGWPPLTRPFLTELRAAMGGRTRIVRARI